MWMAMACRRSWTPRRTADRGEPRRHHRRRCIRSRISSPGERIGPDLELDDLALRTFSAFDVPDEVRAVVRVERTTFPTGIRIVDAAVEPARVEAERVRHAQRRPLP